MVGEIKSEWRARSNRNGGRDHSGIVGDIERNQHPDLGKVVLNPSERRDHACKAAGRNGGDLFGDSDCGGHHCTAVSSSSLTRSATWTTTRPRVPARPISREARRRLSAII